jgi:hypothetical protein
MSARSKLLSKPRDSCAGLRGTLFRFPRARAFSLLVAKGHEYVHQKRTRQKANDIQCKHAHGCLGCKLQFAAKRTVSPTEAKMKIL